MKNVQKNKNLTDCSTEKRKLKRFTTNLHEGAKTPRIVNGYWFPGWRGRLPILTWVSGSPKGLRFAPRCWMLEGVGLVFAREDTYGFVFLYLVGYALFWVDWGWNLG